MSRAHNRVRARPKISVNTTATTASGMNQGTPWPLRMGMSQSKTGLLSDRFMKWNSPVSIVCSQSIADKVMKTTAAGKPNVFQATDHRTPRAGRGG
jgi:hypothetical protein